MKILLLLLLGLAGRAAGLQVGATLVPDNCYYRQLSQDHVAVFCPGIQLAGQPVRNTTVSTAEECAQLCSEQVESCDIYNFAGAGAGQPGNCTLLSLGCNLAPVVAIAPAGVASAALTAGYPVRERLVDLPGFTAQAGQGVPGADLSCNQSVIPGKCAVTTVLDAVVLCIRTPDCEAVVHYPNGTDGCSAPVSLLVHDGLTQSGAFMSPKVATLSRVDMNDLKRTTIMAPNGTVLLPAEGGTATAGGNGNQTYYGCIMEDNVLVSGQPLKVVDGAATAEACCRLCRGTDQCSLFQYCNRTTGCSFQYGPYAIELKYQQCKLLSNTAVALPIGFPPAVVERGPAVPFIGGLPLVFFPPEVPGFERLPGRNQFAYAGGSFDCSASINAQSQECVVAGTPQQVAQTCEQLEQCAGFVLTPGQGGEPGKVTGILKTNIDNSSIGLSPTNALYLREAVSGGASGGSTSGGSSSSLSAGAIAGIVVGAAAAVAAAAAAAWVFVRRRRRSVLGSVPSVDSGQFKDDPGIVVISGGRLGGDGSAVPPSGSAPPSGDTVSSAVTHSSMAGSGSSETPQVQVEALRSITHPASTAGAPARLPSPFARGPKTIPLVPCPYASGPAAAARAASPFAGDPASSAASPFACGAAPSAASPFAGGPAVVAASSLYARGPASARSPFAGSPPFAATATNPFAGGPTRSSSTAGSAPGSTSPGGGLPSSGPSSGPPSMGAALRGSSTSSGIYPLSHPSSRASFDSPGSIMARGGPQRLAPLGGGAALPAAAAILGGPYPSVPTSLRSVAATGTTVASPFAAMRAKAAAAAPSSPMAVPGEQLGLLTPCSFSSGTPSVPSAVLVAGLESSVSATDPGSGSYMLLPELVAHVAEWDAGQHGSDQLCVVGGELHTEQSLLASGTLSQSLQDWLVDIAEVEYLRWPDGRLQELGRGACGVVYKARFRGETVAAKEVDLGRSSAVQALFVTEAERLHQLRHANIVTLYGVCLAGPIGILLMEYAAGRDLHSALQIRKQGTNERLFGWYGRGRTVAYDLSRALNALHAKGVAHLDIKSSNVLLTGSGTAKLADVGAAHIQRGTYLSELPAGSVGTFAWMAPEMMLGQKCTKQADLFSMGVVLWEIATGEAPQRGSMRLPRVPEECPQEVADLIERCMELEVSKRPTAQQLMQQLEALAEKKHRRPRAPATAAGAGASHAEAGGQGGGGGRATAATFARA